MIQLILLSVLLNPVFASNLKSNKEVVREFYETAFNKHQPRLAMEKFVGPSYKQHNPYVDNGKKPFIDYFEEYYKTHKESFIEIKRMIAEDDLVVVHVHSKENKNDRGRAVIDIFRVTDGKISEHWDVGQSIPEKSANKNTMF